MQSGELPNPKSDDLIVEHASRQRFDFLLSPPDHGRRDGRPQRSAGLKFAVKYRFGDWGGNQAFKQFIVNIKSVTGVTIEF